MGIGRQVVESIPWVDLIKGLAGIAFSTSSSTVALYAATSLPFINPKIVQDVWFLTVLSMIVASCLAYFLSLRKFDRPRSLPGYIGGVAFFICVIGLPALAGEIFRPDPATAAFLARMLLLGIFAGFAGVVAWSLAWLFNRPTEAHRGTPEPPLPL
jgi:FtsH-binding integral membrane protein